jgi:hypothetical protein
MRFLETSPTRRHPELRRRFLPPQSKDPERVRTADTPGSFSTAFFNAIARSTTDLNAPQRNMFVV